jgi:DNA-binding CsgD family transcriptional regulator/Tfp pilus assembly protein PilF
LHQVRTRHALYVLTWTEAMYGALASDEARTFAQLTAETDNVRAALSWVCACETPDEALLDTALRSTEMLWFFWRARGQVEEGRRWVEQLLALPGGTQRGRTTALSAAGYLAAEQGDFEHAIANHESSLAIADRCQDEAGRVMALWGIGRASFWQGDLERSLAVYEQGIAIARQRGNNIWLHGFLGNYGSLTIAIGDLDRAKQVLIEGQCASRAARLADSTIITLDLGLIALLRGQHSQAHDIVTQVMGLERQQGPSRFLALSLEHQGWLAVVTSQPRRAAMLLGAAAALRERIGAPIPPVHQSQHAMFIEQARQQMDDERWLAAWDEGHAMSLDAAIDLALTMTLTPEAAPSQPVTALLSPREPEVLRLVVDGQTDREIAAALFISHHTVMRHVSHILTKLGVDSRTAAATWAVRQGLV